MNARSRRIELSLSLSLMAHSQPVELPARSAEESLTEVASGSHKTRSHASARKRTPLGDDAGLHLCGRVGRAGPNVGSDWPWVKVTPRSSRFHFCWKLR